MPSTHLDTPRGPLVLAWHRGTPGLAEAADVLATLEAARAAGAGAPALLVLLDDPTRPPDRATRQRYAAAIAGGEPLAAAAFVVRGAGPFCPLVRGGLRTLLALRRGERPARVFGDLDAACAWLGAARGLPPERICRRLESIRPVQLGRFPLADAR